MNTVDEQLLQAVAQGDVDAVQRALDAGACVNAGCVFHRAQAVGAPFSRVRSPQLLIARTFGMVRKRLSISAINRKLKNRLRAAGERNSKPRGNGAATLTQAVE